MAQAIQSAKTSFVSVSKNLLGLKMLTPLYFPRVAACYHQ